MKKLTLKGFFRLRYKKIILTIGLYYLISISRAIFFSETVLSWRIRFGLKHQRSALDFQFPLCKEGILSRGAPLYQKDHLLPLLNQNGVPCRLHSYSQADLVTCFDTLNSGNSNEEDKLANATNRKIHIAFVGDSRIRQIFGNVIQILPDLEDHSPNLGIATIGLHRVQHDLHVEAPLLRSSVTFNWANLMNDTFFSMINNWIDNRTVAPNYLVIGIASHHMAFSYDSKEANESNTEWPNGFRYSHKTYEKNIIRLWPLLDQLSRKRGVRVVWRSVEIAPYPPDSNATINYFGANKILGYNEISHRIFKSNKVPLEMWDSTNKMYMEYHRMCEFAFQRDAPHTNTRNSGLFVTSWSRCHEVPHPSQSYNTISAQLLINDVCNKVIEKELSRR